MDDGGKEQKGKLDAENEQQAASKLKQMGLFATSIQAGRGAGSRAAAKGRGAAPAKAKKKKGGMVLGPIVIKKKKLTTFTRQLATLLNAGQALVRALRTLER